MSVSINGTSGLVFNDASTQNTAATGFGFKNRIINGAMVIDQRNAGASVTQTTANLYSVDRFLINGSVTTKFTAQQSTTVPAGFKNSLIITSSSAYTVGTSETFTLQQRIEGFNVSDLGWGAAGASAVTLSFWVRSSLTGTFGGSLRNSVGDRSYPFTYTISAANTWEQKTITVAGDTSGTWLTDSGIGLSLTFSLGTGATFSGTAGAWAGANYTSATGATSVVGTSGATFYITGVQLEKGSTATSFDYRPYGTELALCQRYYYRITSTGSGSPFGAGAGSTNVGVIENRFPVTMRTAPTALEQSGTAGDYAVYVGTTITCTGVPTFNSANTQASHILLTATGVVTGQGALGRASNTNAYLGWSAEL